MKKIFLLWCACGLTLVASLATAVAQEPVSTGVVQEVIPSTGVLTIVSDQLHRAVTFYGAGKSNIFSVDGSPAQLSDLVPGTKVTVQYAERNSHWYIDKIMFAEAKPTAPRAPSLPPSTGRVAPVTIVNGTGKN
jgi:hypothetical protein